PPPHPVNSNTKVFCLFVLPFCTLMSAAMVPIIAFKTWRDHTKYLVPRRLVLGGEAVEFVTSHESGTIPWTNFQFYLENRWSFIMWNPRGRSWDLLPKRAFASAADLERCRALLKLRLRPSRWFFL